MLTDMCSIRGQGTWLSPSPSCCSVLADSLIQRPALAYGSRLWIAATNCFRLSPLVTASDVAITMTYEIHATRYGETEFVLNPTVQPL